MNRRGLGVPAYFHPAVSTGWSRLAEAADGLRSVVLNVDSGPGTGPEPALLAAVRGVAERNRKVALLGYVDTDYGARPAVTVLAEVARYLAWYPVAGVFLDRVASGGRPLAWYRRVVERAREAGVDRVVLNPGTVPEHPEYASIADGLVVFEGPYSAYRRLRVPSWLREVPAGRLWHLVYATPRGLLDSALRRGEAQHAGTIYVTDGRGANPWDRLPSYFAEQAAVWSRR